MKKLILAGLLATTALTANAGWNGQISSGQVIDSEGNVFYGASPETIEELRSTGDNVHFRNNNIIIFANNMAYVAIPRSELNTSSRSALRNSINEATISALQDAAAVGNIQRGNFNIDEVINQVEEATSQPEAVQNGTIIPEEIIKAATNVLTEPTVPPTLGAALEHALEVLDNDGILFNDVTGNTLLDILEQSDQIIDFYDRNRPAIIENVQEQLDRVLTVQEKAALDVIIENAG